MSSRVMLRQIVHEMEEMLACIKAYDRRDELFKEAVEEIDDAGGGQSLVAPVERVGPAVDLPLESAYFVPRGLNCAAQDW
jgi:hypothetical protein